MINLIILDDFLRNIYIKKKKNALSIIYEIYSKDLQKDIFIYIRSNFIQL